jgi:hypothetical protein
MNKRGGGDGMQTKFEKGLAIALLVTAMAACANSQAVPRTLGDASRPEILVTGTTPGGAMGHVLKVIDDPHTGARWLLVRDGDHPAGPARLLLVADASLAPRDRGEASMNSGATQFEPVSSHPVIRTGDRLVVEENSAVADTRIEAVALGPAGVGSGLDVRLKISGKVLRAKALGSGRAEFLTGFEVWR